MVKKHRSKDAIRSAVKGEPLCSPTPELDKAMREARKNEEKKAKSKNRKRRKTFWEKLWE